MTDHTLTARSAFAKQPNQHAGLTLDAIEPPAIVSIAIPNGGEAALVAALQGAYNIDLPAVGQTVISDDATFLRLARDQMFVLFPQPANGRPTDAVADVLGETAYLTDQSDSWATLRIAGGNCRAALERICPLDLDAAIFPPGTVARTAMEHLGVIVLCEAAEHFCISLGNWLSMLWFRCRNVDSVKTSSAGVCRMPLSIPALRLRLKPDEIPMTLMQFMVDTDCCATSVLALIEV